MKKILFYYRVLIFLSFFILFNYSVSQAQSTVNVSAGNIWSEYISNPLFGGPADGSTRGYYPCVLKVGSVYHIWYGDGSNTRHAAGSSPNFSGATFPAPVVSGIALPAYHPHVLYNVSGWDVGGIHYADPFLLYSPTSDWAHVYIYRSADGDSWTLIDEVTGVHAYGGNSSVYNLDVVYEGGTTWKAYADNGFGNIQYYVSTNGKDWTGTAINILGSNYQNWESNHSYTAPHVIKTNGAYIMFFGSGTTNNNQALGMAISTDGQNFVKSNGNPIFTTSGSPPAWRDERTYTPYVVQDGANWLMYFTGKNLSTGNYSIGYATNTGLYWLIQDAINAAQPSWTVNVAAGTYDAVSTIIINKGITITGPLTGTATARNTAVPTPAAKSTSVFEIAASNVTIEKLNITVETSTAYNATLFDESQSALIRVPNGAHLTGIIIRNNNIYVPVQPGAMSTWGHLAITLSDNASDGSDIYSNTVYNTRNGIVIRSHDYSNITNNTIYNTKGGIMNYTADQTDANNRIMNNNSWGSAHNEWDIVWNSFAYFVPDYQLSVLALSNANNGAYVVDRRAIDGALTLTGNRSHIFVNGTTGTLTVHPANGNINVPYATVSLGVSAVVPGGKVLVAAGTYNEDVNGDGKNSLLLTGMDPANRPVINGNTHFSPCNDLQLKNLILRNTAGPSIAYIGGLNFTMDKVKVDGENISSKFGISGGQINGNVTITNSEFLNIRNWVAFDTRSGSGGPTSGSLLNNVIFTGNLIDNTIGHINFRGTIGSNTSNVTISGNTIQNIGSATNSFGGIIKVLYADNCIFTGNTIKDVGTSGYNPAGEAPYGCGFMPRNVTNLTVTDNIFQNNNQAIAFEPRNSVQGGFNDGVISNGLINNNTFIDNTYGIYVPATLNPVSNLSGLLINNNSLTENTVHAVHNGYSAGLLDARYNWWGTVVESEIQSKIFGNINYTPWIGSLESKPITNADLNTPVNFTTANTSLTFTSLPPATNATVTVQRIESTNPPTGVPGYPHSAGNGLPLYLMITATGLTNYTFSVTVVIDVSNINGFNPNTEVMYYSTASNSWVGIDGVYSPSAKTFTFTTDHFTPFGFVNPTNPNDIYLSQLTTDPVNTQKWYPAVDMGAPGIPSPDWNYVNAKATYYVVPTGTTGMFSSKFAVVWDKSKANLTVTAGDYWGTDQMFYSIDSSVGNNGRYWVNVASPSLTNQVPGGGKYIAKLDFTNIKPGYIPVSIDGTDFRYFANDEQQGVYVTTHPGKILFYLGDVAKLGNETMGDGKIQFEDLTLFSGAYWSILGTHPSYKYKYDIGPTNANGSYWALPTPDGRIEFEDLNIFAIGYGKTGAGQLPDNPGENKMNISTLAMKYENGYFKVPVKVSGVVNDFRTGSFEFGYSSGELEYAGFEKKGGFEGDDNFMLSKTENNKIMLDAAIVGAEKTGMNGEQIIMNLLFTEKQSGSHNVNVLTARARNSGNTPIDISFDGSNGASSEIPTTFTLNQNYPNPFNPGTTIKYGLPKDAKVSLVVFDILGRKVMTLVNDNQKAGYHEVQFNALNLSSGTYFYRIIAGDFTSIKRMVLIK